VPVPHIPSPIEQLGHRPFSFYPAIVNIEHNEWTFRRNGWDEIQVMNTKTQEELWIPRRFLSGVSSIEEPVVIVGLVKELEFREGVVIPHVRRVIEMPRAVNDTMRRRAPEPEPGRLAQVVGIRLENEPESRTSRMLFGTVAAGILTCVVAMAVIRTGPAISRARFFSSSPRVALPFTAADDYLAIVSRIGRPARERPQSAPNGLQFYLLRYPDRSYTLVLLGEDRDHARYAGAFGRGGRVIHSVVLPDGRDSTTALERLLPF
jgi:hypothetical protein